MSWTTSERAEAGDLARLTYVNPFTPERMQLEHRLLGLPPPPADHAWHPQGADDQARFERLAAIAERLLQVASTRGGPAPEEADDHDSLAVYALYYRYLAQLTAAAEGPADAALPWLGAFADEARDLTGRAMPRGDIEHLAACLIQVRRAFTAIFAQLVGASPPMVRLRAACWHALFGTDLRRYRRALWSRMRDFPILVTGPSGSGKELVAQAVGQSGYIPVDGRVRRLAGGGDQPFLPLSISALPPALVEAELFGHRKGAFTGASEERAGWLEVCPAHGCVFLDEIGEVEPALQVKLLRVLQTRAFTRVGEHAPRGFRGRLLSATNRDLAAGIAGGTFRADVYYRLCADQLRTPSLRELLDADPDELDRLVLVLAGRIAGPDEGVAVAEEAVAWIRRELGAAYAWPGNVRELEQCIRNLLTRGAYTPAHAPDHGLAERVRAGDLDAEELLDRYCAQVATAAGGWREAARRLGMDWRTVARRSRRAGSGS